ncbi:hypothetical protein NDU88_003699 [Pleurodeles waltl]|uniref:Uncharacterized protein n=1 Tax=Pleurodeles waltl TaxID=8319 RepID=A0AAV7UZ72_PLEWA|nr:hypothetical protein NDU88_003699 [Pleurodeles waltl]
MPGHVLSAPIWAFIDHWDTENGSKWDKTLVSQSEEKLGHESVLNLKKLKEQSVVEAELLPELSEWHKGVVAEHIRHPGALALKAL